MRYLRSAFLIALLLISLSLIGIGIFWVFDNIFQFDIDGFVISGIKSGFIATIILIIMNVFLKEKRKKAL